MDNGNNKLIVLLLIVLTVNNYGQFYTGGGGPNASFRQYFHAKDASLCGAAVANIDGAMAAVVNPAGSLMNFDQNNKSYFNLSITNMQFIERSNNPGDIASQQNNLWGIGLSTSQYGNFNFGIILLGKVHSNIARTEILGTTNEIITLGKFGYAEYLGILNVSYFWDNFIFGINIKGAHNSFDAHDGFLQLENTVANRFAGFDLGMMARTGENTVSVPIPFLGNSELFSLDSIDYGIVFKFDRDDINQQITLKFGASLHFLNKWTLHSSMSVSDMVPFELSIGPEYNPIKNISLRMGLKSSYYKEYKTNKGSSLSISDWASGLTIGSFEDYLNARLDVSYSFLTIGSIEKIVSSVDLTRLVNPELKMTLSINP